jgi:RNA polymerase sigma-70 factor (ECF subfamily)
VRAAYNLARWLVGNDEDAEDIVQESFLKAFAASSDFRGENARVWLFAIVRNTTMSHLRRRRSERVAPWRDGLPEPADKGQDPETAMIGEARRARLRAEIEALPEEYREVIVLRELEGLAYKDIAAVARVPIGTVMSRLNRARGLLLERLAEERRAGNELSRL